MLLARFLIAGHSMEPTLKNGSFVLVSSIPYLFAKPKVRDIIAFKKRPAFAKASAGKEKIFIKRIAKINLSTSSGEKCFVKGDNKKDSLEIGWIDKKEILGKVIAKI